MTISIKKSDKEGRKDTLQLSGLLPGEFAIVEKVQFAEPKTGKYSGKFGETTWHMYSLFVHEFTTLNDEADKIQVKVGKEVSFFTYSEVLAGELTRLPLNVKVKVRQLKPEPGRKSGKYVVELLGAPLAEAATPASPTATMSLPDFIKAQKTAAVPIKIVKTLAMKNYSIDEIQFNLIYNAV